MLEINFIAIIVSALIGYLIGSVMFAVIISKYKYGSDIRTMGSGNAGMSNMMRNFGKKAGIATFAGDMLKGTVSVVVANLVTTYLFNGNEITVLLATYIAAFANVIGHMFPIYFGFKGGKGVATGVGCVMGLYPPIAPVLLIIFYVVFKTSKMFSLGSIVATACFPLIQLLLNVLGLTDFSLLAILLSTVLSLMVIGMHYQNIKRLVTGTETKYNTNK